ncbi:MAG: hypothetical protein AB7O80_13570 [Acetobacteraceae bacterium]
MTSTSNMPPSNNPAWGFFGTIAHHTEADAAWRLAMTAIADTTGSTPDEVRAFLDSRHGRHFVDDVANALVEGHPLAAAIATATSKWMDWTITRATARETGIPQGLPYLAGFVMHAAIEADATD